MVWKWIIWTESNKQGKGCSIFSIYQMKITLDFLTQLPLQLAGSNLVDTEAPALQGTQMPSDAAQGIILSFILG